MAVNSGLPSWWNDPPDNTSSVSTTPTVNAAIKVQVKKIFAEVFFELITLYLIKEYKPLSKAIIPMMV